MAHFLSQLVSWFGDGAHWHSTNGTPGIPALLVGHVEIVALALAVAMVVALPLGLWLGHTGRAGFAAINITNVGRALPAIAVLVLAAQAFGIGRTPALIALTVLSIPPILTNTYTAIQGVAAADTDAARGMGMTEAQILTRVEIPASVPLIFAGVRTAAVQAVATATLAGFVAYDCFGTLINLAISTGDHVTLTAGALLVVALALATEYGLGALQTALTPAGLRLGSGAGRARRLSRRAADSPLVDAVT